MQGPGLFFGCLLVWMGGFLCGLGVGTSTGVDETQQEAIQNHYAHYDTVTREFKWGP